MIALLALAAATPAEGIAAAERAFAARAQTEGQWKAFRATAAPDAIMFVPDVQLASKALATAKEPPVPVMWWPATIAASCDGTLGVSTGPWVRAASGGFGTFTTVWKKVGDGYRWRLDHGRNTPKLIATGNAPTVIAATCEGLTAAGSAAREAAFEQLAASVAAKAGTEGAAAFAEKRKPNWTGT